MSGHRYTEHIVCPYCLHALRDSSEYAPGEEDIGDVDCGECERVFTARRVVTVEYVTEAIEGKP